MLGRHDISRYTQGLTLDTESGGAEQRSSRLGIVRASLLSDIREIVMKLTGLRLRAAILLFTLTASAFNSGRAFERLEGGVGTELTLLVAVAGALTAFGSAWLILVLLRKRGVQLPVETGRDG